MTKFILASFGALFLAVGISSCQSLFGEGTVVTTLDQVQDHVDPADVPPIPLTWLPEEIQAQIPEGTQVVLASRNQLKEDASFVPLDGTQLDDDAVSGIVSTAFEVGSLFIPGLAAWEGVVALFSRRKRKHYIEAAKAATPYDGRVDLASAVGSLAAALGAAHSTEGSKAVAELEMSGQNPEVLEG